MGFDVMKISVPVWKFLMADFTQMNFAPFYFARSITWRHMFSVLHFYMFVAKPGVFIAPVTEVTLEGLLICKKDKVM